MKKSSLLLAILLCFSVLFYAQHKLVLKKKSGAKIEVNTDSIEYISIEEGIVAADTITPVSPDPTPVIPDTPEDTTSKDDPSTPDTPVTPEDTTHKDDPVTPDTPVTPEDTTHKDDPVTPDTPDTPVTPSSDVKPSSFPVADAVDLGLPSGTKWASWNIGATTDYEFGGYYGWGDPTGEKTATAPSSSYHYGSDISGTQYDFITVKWGKGWSTPTKAQFEELSNPDYTSMRYTANYMNTGVSGWIITSLQDDTKYVFFPNAGFIDRSGNLQYKNKSCFCWTGQWDDASQCAFRASIVSEGTIDFGTSAAALQTTIRGVYNDGTSGGGGGGTSSDDYGVSPAKLVDLALPCGTLWATCNLGATTATEYGGYYAWGATETQNEYTKNSYEYYNTKLSVYDTETRDYILSDDYDTAHKIWGGKWRMPTLTETQQLVSYCTWTWTDSYNNSGVSGYVVTGENGSSIFLPASGYKSGTYYPDEPDKNLYYQGIEGCYWTSSDYTRDGLNSSAYEIMFTSSVKTNNSQLRHLGVSIRPVMSK